MGKAIFISGINTDSGKTIVTGLLAKFLLTEGFKVITQKYIQTGCIEISDDLKIHRQIMQLDWLEEDLSRLTCSYLFKYPASPHLSASIENVKIETEKITHATNTLSGKYDYVLMEGAGGLIVPINENTTILDYIQQQKYPVILVSNGVLGSINHTLLSLEVLKHRKINLIGIVYNQYPKGDLIINKDSEQTIKNFMLQYFPNAGFVSIPEVNLNSSPVINFSSILKQ
ncbi:MAG: ATP-dependent dethiobiotin synthetase BioD [Bacteroidales bacterium]|nr:ATP-dependent dethiobiotin synthetase BioD [Bacteroidales bacterium]